MSTERPGLMKRYGDPILTGVIAAVLGAIVIAKFSSTPAPPMVSEEEKKEQGKKEVVRPPAVGPEPSPEPPTEHVRQEEEGIIPVVEAQYFVDGNSDGYGDPNRPARKNELGAVANGKDRMDGSPCLLRMVRNDAWRLCAEGGGGQAVLELELTSPSDGHGVAGKTINVEDGGGEAFHWIRAGTLARQDKHNVLTSTVTTDAKGHVRITFDIPANAGRSASTPQSLLLGYMPEGGGPHAKLVWTAKSTGDCP